jgi:hypothetical protein
MVDVFISYSRTDLAHVTQLARAVEAEGYQVWWDADLPPHLSYGDVITAKIGMAKAAIVVWSQASAASEWVRAEADMARNQKKLIQTALDNVMPPLPFNQIQFAEIGDWHGEPDHPGWRKVKTSLAELCGAREARAAPPVAPPVVVTAIPVVDESLPPPASAAPSRWPLYAGVGIAAVALVVAGWVALHQGRGEETAAAPTVEASAPAPVTAQPAPAPPVAAPPEATVRQAVAAPLAEPEAAPAAAPAASSDPRVVFPDSSRRLLQPSEVASLGPATLSIARNEIFARNGRMFKSPDLRRYFEQFEWYHPTSFDVTLNAIEKKNVLLIRAAEAKYGQ